MPDFVELHEGWGDGSVECCELCGAEKEPRYTVRDEKPTVEEFCLRWLSMMMKNPVAFEVLMMLEAYSGMTYEEIASWVMEKHRHHESYTRQAVHLQAKRWAAEFPNQKHWLLRRIDDGNG